MKEDAREDAERATAVADVTRFLDKLGMTGTSSEWQGQARNGRGKLGMAGRKLGMTSKDYT